MDINKTTLKAFREDFKNVIKTLEDKYELTIELGGITYDSSGFHVKMEATSGSSDEAERTKFEKAAMSFKYYGITADMYNKEFVGRDGKTYALVGLNTKAPKNACIIRAVNGKQYKCPMEFLGLGKPVSPLIRAV